MNKSTTNTNTNALLAYLESKPQSTLKEYITYCQTNDIPPVHENTFYRYRAAQGVPAQPDKVNLPTPPAAELLQAPAPTPVPTSLNLEAAPVPPPAPFCIYTLAATYIPFPICGVASLLIYHTISISLGFVGFVPTLVLMVFSATMGFTPLIIARAPNYRGTYFNVICTALFALDLLLSAFISPESPKWVMTMVAVYYAVNMAITVHYLKTTK